MAKRDPINLEKEFETYFSLAKVKKVMAQIERQPTLVAEARKLLFDKDPQRSMRGAWLLLHISFEHPKLITPHLQQLIDFLYRENNHTGAIRNIVRIFQEIDLPEIYCGPIFDLCISYIKNSTLPHAVRAFSINTIGNICKKYPELKPEVILILNELKEFPQPPSLNASMTKLSKILLKL